MIFKKIIFYIYIYQIVKFKKMNNEKKPRIDKIKNSSIECKDDEKRCKECCLPKQKNYFIIENKSGRVVDSKYCLECREKRAINRKTYYDKNVEKLNKMCKEYRERNHYHYEYKPTKCDVCNCEVKIMNVHLKSKKHLNYVKLINELKEKRDFNEDNNILNL